MPTRLPKVSMDTREANQLIELLGRHTKRELSNRGKLETILFPNSAYENLGSIEVFYRYPEIVRAISRKVSPEEIGQTCLKYGTDIITMQVWTVGFQFLWGRQILLGLGAIRPGDHVAEILQILDFWKRLTLAYRRDGHLCNGEAGYTNRVLTQEEVTHFTEEALPLEEEQKDLFLRLHGKVLSFLILMNCESRAKYGVTGPYELGDGEVMIVTDFVDLMGVSYPWGMPEAFPFNHLTMAIVLKDVRLRLANAGLAYGRPANFLQNATRAAVYVSEKGVLSPLEPQAWGEVIQAVTATNVRLYRKFASMSLRERILAGASVYFWFIKPLAEFAGAAAEIDWALSRALDFYETLKDPAFADSLFERCLILPQDVPSSYDSLPEEGTVLT